MMKYIVRAYRNGEKIFSEVREVSTLDTLGNEKCRNEKEVIDKWNRIGSIESKINGLSWHYILLYSSN